MLGKSKSQKIIKTIHPHPKRKRIIPRTKISKSRTKKLIILPAISYCPNMGTKRFSIQTKNPIRFSAIQKYRHVVSITSRKPFVYHHKGKLKKSQRRSEKMIFANCLSPSIQVKKYISQKYSIFFSHSKFHSVYFS